MNPEAELAALRGRVEDLEDQVANQQRILDSIAKAAGGLPTLPAGVPASRAPLSAEDYRIQPLYGEEPKRRRTAEKKD